MQHFYELLRERINYKDELDTDELNNMPKSTNCVSHFKSNAFEVHLNEYNELLKTDSSKKYDIIKDHYNSNLPCSDLMTKPVHYSPTWNVSADHEANEMSFEEIDKSYRELQLQDIESGINIENYIPDDNMHASLSDSLSDDDSSFYHVELPTPKRRKTGAITSTNDSFLHQTIPFKETQSYNSSQIVTIPSSTAYVKSTLCEMDNPIASVLNSEPSFNFPDNAVKIKQRVSFLNVDNAINSQETLCQNTMNSQKTVCKKFNASQYKCLKKRKSTNNYSTCSKSMKISPELNCFAVQKGLCSKTVCKQTWFKRSPLSQIPRGSEDLLYPPSSNMFPTSISQHQIPNFVNPSKFSQNAGMYIIFLHY